MNLTLQDLKYVIVPAKRPRPHQEKHYDMLFSFWHHSFKKVFEEISKPNQYKFSDQFLLQDEVGGLFFKDQVVAIIFYSWIDCNRPSELARSYFSHYTDPAMNFLTQQSNEIMVMSNLAVHPLWRKKKTNLDIASLMIEFAIKRLNNSKASHLISFTRNDRKMHEVVYSFGGKRIDQHIAFDIPSDIIAISNQGLTRSPLKNTSPEFV